MGTKKLFMFLIMGLFLISMVSAVQKDYDANTRTVKLNSNFFLLYVLVSP